MKRIFLLLIVLVAVAPVYASLLPVKPDSAAGAAVSVSIGQVYRMSAKELAGFTGRKLTWKDRIAFAMLKRELKKEIRKGNEDADALQFLSAMRDEGRFRFNIPGFLLGLLLGIFGVGIAYIVSRSRDVHTSSWIGFGVLVIAAIVMLFSIFPGGG